MATKASICTYIVVCSIMGYLGLSEEIMGILVVLLAIDFITGLAKSYYVKKDITSSKMTYGLIRKLLVLIVPVVGALCIKAVGYDPNNILSFFLAGLCLSEGYSILGNITSIRNKKEYAEFDGVNVILTAVMDMIARIIKKYIDEHKELTDHGVKTKTKKKK